MFWFDKAGTQAVEDLWLKQPNPVDSRPRQSRLRSRRATFKQATNQTIGVVPVLIKKKDVNDYFAARKGRHPLSVNQASAVASTKSSNVKRANKSSSVVASINVPERRRQP